MLNSHLSRKVYLKIISASIFILLYWKGIASTNIILEAIVILKNSYARATQEGKMTEHRKLLARILDVDHFELKNSKQVFLIKSKPPFRPIFQVAIKNEESNNDIIGVPSTYKVKKPPAFPVGTGGTLQEDYWLRR